MSASLKRKGSPNLASVEESSKRRFAESEDAQASEQPSKPPIPLRKASEDDNGHTDDQSSTSAQEINPPDNPTAATSSAPSQPDRAARFAALRARNRTSRKENLQETKSEAQRAAVDPTQLNALQRKRDIAQHKLLQAEVEEDGEDFERKRAWDWTVEESERWDKRQAKKALNRESNAFQDYSRQANKVYQRQLGQMNKASGAERLEAYAQDKQAAVERAVRSGGLEIVETGDGELIAVDKDGSFLSTADSSATFTENKPSRAAVDRLVEDIRKAEEVRLKKRRDRGRADDDGSDVTYINEKNKQFNMKLARFYNKYTADIRESFERGSAI